MAPQDGKKVSRPEPSKLIIVTRPQPSRPEVITPPSKPIIPGAPIPPPPVLAADVAPPVAPTLALILTGLPFLPNLGVTVGELLQL